jgi:hypothetical protein
MRQTMTEAQLCPHLNRFRFAVKDDRRHAPVAVYRLRDPGVFGQNWIPASGYIDDEQFETLARRYDIA